MKKKSKNELKYFLTLFLQCTVAITTFVVGNTFLEFLKKEQLYRPGDCVLSVKLNNTLYIKRYNVKNNEYLVGFIKDISYDNVNKISTFDMWMNLNKNETFKTDCGRLEYK